MVPIGFAGSIRLTRGSRRLGAGDGDCPSVTGASRRAVMRSPARPGRRPVVLGRRLCRDRSRSRTDSGGRGAVVAEVGVVASLVVEGEHCPETGSQLAAPLGTPVVPGGALVPLLAEFPVPPGPDDVGPEPPELERITIPLCAHGAAHAALHA